MIGTEPLLGVRPSKEYLFYIFTSPVGPYFPGVGVVRLVVLDVHRASPNGTGDAKAAANYPGTMRPKVEAKKQGLVENAQECFLCGTGATITAISEIGWKGTVHNVNHNNFQLAHQLFDLLSGIQLQKIEDPYGWVHIVK